MKRINCLLVVFFYWCVSQFQRVPFEEFAKKKLEDLPVFSGGASCLIAWMFVSAINERKPQQILDIYSYCDGNVKIGRKLVIACVESAIWLNDKGVAEAFLNDDEYRNAFDFEVTHYLHALYDWAFLKDSSQVLEIKAPPVVVVFDYVFSFAKATALDERDCSDALLYYRRSLEDMPLDSPHYKYAMDRCNVLLNR